MTTVDEEKRAKWKKRKDQPPKTGFSTDQTLSRSHLQQIVEQQMTHAKTARARMELATRLWAEGKVSVSYGDKPWIHLKYRVMDASIADGLLRSVQGNFADGFTTRDLHPDWVNAGAKASTDSTLCVLLGLWTVKGWRRPPEIRKSVRVYKVTQLAIDTTG